MISIAEIYDDVALDAVNSAENGQLSYAMFNRLSKRAELRMLDYLSGDVENIKPPMPYIAQKVKDWLSPFITPYPSQVVNGKITKPDDYYGFENMFLLGNYNAEVERDEEIESEEGCNISIELLDGSKFYNRCNTFIEGLEPSFTKPIAKLVGNTFEFLPKDLGSITLEYIRYPVFGKIVVIEDTVRNDEIIDTNASTNYEWDEFARELLVYFISQQFSVHTREKSLLEHTQVTGKLVRG